MKLGIHEILTLVGNEKSRKKKIELLQKYSSPTLKMVLGFTYDPNIEWLLPEGPTPEGAYKPNDPSADMQGQFYAAVTSRMMKFFVKGQSGYVEQWKREKIFLDLLETLDPDDAKVVIQMKDRKLKYDGMTRNLTMEAFPSMTQNWTSKGQAEQ